MSRHLVNFPEVAVTLATPQTSRQRWMAVLARASAEQISGHLSTLPALSEAAILRGPEPGLVMLRGRAGGGGQAFNLGEASVTRCTIRDAEGRVGHAYRLGRDTDAALLSARLDAALQDPDRADALLHGVIAPLAETQQQARDASAGRAAATRVQFFTMATMRTNS
jgi:alpha-D-ribose 1-methylphosphonate 5-triphosphate synthase subunit PhnG